ncbi:MAG: type II toxin-antitoxin system YoeB family toxin [Ginsengibacter sp.]
MEVAFDELALKDIQFWKEFGNVAIQKKIQKLILNIQESPYLGIEKPELLKYDLAGIW